MSVPIRVTLLREVSDGPVAALFAGERRRQDVSLVAVKVLHHPHTHDEHFLRDLRERGRHLARLAHPNLVAATELVLVDGSPALVGPWVEGIDLLDWLEALREHAIELPGRVVCEILRSIALGLDAALSRTPWGDERPLGLIHSDLKPSNVMVSRDGLVRVLDLGTGLTSLSGDEGIELSKKAGLERYLSPGRRQGEVEGPESDVYALGVLGVELCRGRWLRRTRSENPEHDRHLAEVVAALPDPGMRSEADERALRALLLRMVAFDPDARPPAVEVAQTLRTLADRAPGASLETFVHAHALPFIEPPHAHPGLPDAVVIEPEDLPEPLESPASLADVLERDVDPTTGTERLAQATEQALAEYRERRAADHVARRPVRRLQRVAAAPPPVQSLGAAPWFALAGAAALGAAGMLAVVGLVGVLIWLWV